MTGLVRLNCVMNQFITTHSLSFLWESPACLACGFSDLFVQRLVVDLLTGPTYDVVRNSWEGLLPPIRLKMFQHGSIFSGLVG